MRSRAFLAWMHRFFGAHVHDAGRLRKPEEAIKYPFKPADLARLDGQAMAWVYRQTQKLKIAQPLGDGGSGSRASGRRTSGPAIGGPCRRACAPGSR